MPTTIEVTASAIRLCVHADQRIISLDSWPVPPGADPVVALAAAPLPDDLGKVRVLLHHDDLLIRTLIQPACPPERLDKLVRFELGSLSAPGSAETPPSAISWHLVPVAGSDGDLRVLAQVTRSRLVDRVRQALAARGARLAALSHSGLGLFHSFKAQVPEHQGVAVLVDVGGAHVHLALVRDGCLIFLRTHVPGMDELVRQVAARRGLAEADAMALTRRITSGSPEDLKELIAAQAGALSAMITANVRFCRSQLRLGDFEPTHVYIAGAGAMGHGYLKALGERSRLIVRLLNPFAGHLSRLSTELSDRLASLPNAWCPVIGGASAATWELDALADERLARQRYWRSEGALKAAAAAALLLTGLGIVRTEAVLADVSSIRAELDERVPQVQDQAKQVAALRDQQQGDAARLMWLDGERRPGRVALELLACIGKLQDPATCPVVLTGCHFTRQSGAIEVVLQGAATSAKVSAEMALRFFKDGLQREYPAIATIIEQPVSIDQDRLSFKYVLVIPDV
jgi:hypothetical protein